MEYSLYGLSFRTLSSPQFNNHIEMCIIFTLQINHLIYPWGSVRLKSKVTLLPPPPQYIVKIQSRLRDLLN